MNRFSERLYRALICLYPPSFRRAYGSIMLGLFRDLYREAQTRGTVAVLALWLHLLSETPRRAFIEHRDAALLALRSPSAPPVVTRLHLLFLALPLLAIIAYTYASQGYGDLALVYLLVLAAGLIGWGLNQVRILPANPLWNAYTRGVLLGIAAIIFFFLSSIPALGVYRLSLPPILVLAAGVAVYAAGINLSGRLLREGKRAYHITALLLLLTTTAAYLLIPLQYLVGEIELYLSLNYALAQTLGTLVICAVCVWLAGRHGRLAMVTLMVALGVQFVIVDPAYFTGHAAQWINLAVLNLPLVVCPAWWLLAKTHRARVRGTLILWGVLIGIAAVAPSAARAVMDLDYETPGVWLRRVLTTLPYFAALVLALRMGGSIGKDVQPIEPTYSASAGEAES